MHQEERNFRMEFLQRGFQPQEPYDQLRHIGFKWISRRPEELNVKIDPRFKTMSSYERAKYCMENAYNNYYHVHTVIGSMLYSHFTPKTSIISCKVCNYATKVLRHRDLLEVYRHFNHFGQSRAIDDFFRMYQSEQNIEKQISQDIVTIHAQVQQAKDVLNEFERQVIRTKKYDSDRVRADFRSDQGVLNLRYRCVNPHYLDEIISERKSMLCEVRPKRKDFNPIAQGEQLDKVYRARPSKKTKPNEIPMQMKPVAPENPDRVYYEDEDEKLNALYEAAIRRARGGNDIESSENSDIREDRIDRQ